MKRLVAVVAAVASVVACEPGRPPSPPPTRTSAPSADIHYLSGTAMSRPTRLSVVVAGWWLDVDRGRRTPLGITGWLAVPGGRPLLVEEVSRPGDTGTTAVSTRILGDLPGRPTVVRLTRPDVNSAAASADGRAVWLGEYRTRDRCTIRQVSLTGGQLRPPRDVPCGI